MSDKEKSALKLGAALGLVGGIVVAFVLCVARGHHASHPGPCQDSVWMLDGNDDVTCPAQTRLEVRELPGSGYVRALCLCPRP